MGRRAKRQIKRVPRKLIVEAEHRKFLARFGITGKPKTKAQLLGVERPNLKVEQTVAPTSDMSGAYGIIAGKRGLPAGAKQFPSGSSHKQGPQLLTPGMMGDLEWMGGKKT